MDDINCLAAHQYIKGSILKAEGGISLSSILCFKYVSSQLMEILVFQSKKRLYKVCIMSSTSYLYVYMKLKAKVYTKVAILKSLN